MTSTVQQALEHATATLIHLPDDEQIGRILLAHVLGQSPPWLWTHSTTRLTQDQQERFFELVNRASTHEPIGYLIGEREFYGRPFTVTKHTLIPRPETETLIDLGLKHAAAISRLPDNEDSFTIVDVGTGSGAIAITLACELPSSQIWAIDLSAAALEIAHQNAKHHGVASRICFLEGSLLEPLVGQAAPHSIDLIVANLPYISDADYPSLPPTIRLHEPALALRSGPTANALNDQLAQQVPAWLKPHGLFAYETTNGQIVLNHPIGETLAS